MQEKLIVNLSQEEEIRATVPDINYIPAYKVAEEQRRANELERIEYYEDLQEKVNSGEMNGKNTVYVGTEEPTDDFYNVWIDPNGKPETSAENIIFSDNETLETKIANQDKVIDDAVSYMETNLTKTITQLIAEMRESGELSEDILNAFEDITDMITAIDKRLKIEESKETYFIYNAETEELNLNCGVREVN